MRTHCSGWHSTPCQSPHSLIDAPDSCRYWAILIRFQAQAKLCVAQRWLVKGAENKENRGLRGARAY